MRLLIVAAALIISACANTGGSTFAQRLSAGIQHYNQTQDDYRNSREPVKIDNSNTQFNMPVTDWKCMSDCQKANYKQATCDNMCVRQ